MRRPRAPATMVHSLSCTDADWERVRERADAAGLSISRYLVERGLTVALPRGGDGKVRLPPRLVLEEGEQREMRDRIVSIADRMSAGASNDDETELLRLRRMVAFLLKTVLLDTIRDGRTREMTAMLAEVFGEEEAVEIAEVFVKRARSEGLID